MPQSPDHPRAPSLPSALTAVAEQLAGVSAWKVNRTSMTCSAHRGVEVRSLGGASRSTRRRSPAAAIPAAAARVRRRVAALRARRARRRGPRVRRRAVVGYSVRLLPGQGTGLAMWWGRRSAGPRLDSPGAPGCVTLLKSTADAGLRSAAPVPPAADARGSSGSSRIEPTSDERHPQHRPCLSGSASAGRSVPARRGRPLTRI